MCCVQLGSKFYFFGGKYDDLDLCDDGDIDEEIKKKYSNVTRMIIHETSIFLTPPQQLQLMPMMIS